MPSVQIIYLRKFYLLMFKIIKFNFIKYVVTLPFVIVKICEEPIILVIFYNYKQTVFALYIALFTFIHIVKKQLQKEI